MLRALHIHNLAIIDAIELSFAEGMNVLTGETGAGKSILMRAIGLLCGERATAELLRTDADEATIEGVFDLAPAEQSRLTDVGLEATAELLVRRLIARNGKGRIYVNGTLATAGLLAQIGNRLIHIYGQHEQALLLKPESHVEYLDQIGKHDELRAEMAERFAVARHAEAHLARLLDRGATARQRLDLLQFQRKELADAGVAAGEEASLQQEREVQRHAERLLQTCQQGEEVLYSGEQPISAALGRLLAQLQEAARIDGGLAPTADLLRGAAADIDEVALQLRHAAGRLEHDPARLQEIDDRLALLTRLKRKYDCDADQLAERLAAVDSELAMLEKAGFDVDGARSAAAAAATAAWQTAHRLTAARRRAAAVLEKRVADELAPLGMRGTVFRVVFGANEAIGDAAHTTDGLSAGGADQIEFYLSANPGEEPRALARTASGGELSRIMLALKTLTAGAGEVPTLIFDEVDAGIGGSVAEAVGQRLRALAATRQVLCITHLPQIAAQADHHYAVEKKVSKGRTRTSARKLDAEERVAEIARMLGNEAEMETQQYARRLVRGPQRRSRS